MSLLFFVTNSVLKSLLVTCPRPIITEWSCGMREINFFAFQNKLDQCYNVLKVGLFCDGPEVSQSIDYDMKCQSEYEVFVDGNKLGQHTHV